MTEHEQIADRAEAEVDRMQHESDQLGERIEGARRDWEAKKADPGVPGAAGDPDRAEEGPVPEAEFTGKSDADSREPWPDE